MQLIMQPFGWRLLCVMLDFVCQHYDLLTAQLSLSLPTPAEKCHKMSSDLF